MSTYYSRGRVAVTVVSGSNLAAKDLGGKSDPYCLVQSHQHGIAPAIATHHKTQIIKKSLNPAWNESVPPFEVGTLSRPPYGGTKDVLRLEVWDWDRVGSDDFMGVATVMLQDDERLKSGEEVELDLVLGTKPEAKDEVVSGSIKVKVTFTNLELDLIRAAEEKAKRDAEEAERQAVEATRLAFEANRLAAEAQERKRQALAEAAAKVQALSKQTDDPEALTALLDFIKSGVVGDVTEPRRVLLKHLPAMIDDGRAPATALPLLLAELYDQASVPILIPDHKRSIPSKLESDAEGREIVLFLLTRAFGAADAKYFLEEVLTQWADNARRESWYPSQVDGEIEQWLKRFQKVLGRVSDNKDQWPVVAYGVALVLRATLMCTLWNIDNSNERYHSEMASTLLSVLKDLSKGIGAQPPIPALMRPVRNAVMAAIKKHAYEGQKQDLLLCFDDPAQWRDRPGYLGPPDGACIWH